jgi:hypothetical protein
MPGYAAKTGAVNIFASSYPPDGWVRTGTQRDDTLTSKPKLG